MYSLVTWWWRIDNTWGDWKNKTLSYILLFSCPTTCRCVWRCVCMCVCMMNKVYDWRRSWWAHISVIRPWRQKSLYTWSKIHTCQMWIPGHTLQVSITENFLGTLYLLKRVISKWDQANYFPIIIIFLKLIYLYLFLALLGLRFCARAFSSCGERGPLFIAVRGPLTVTASLAVEHKLQTRRLSSCGARA